MELDLRSFLLDDTEAADLHTTHHRTVDEILNDCDTSSSSSSHSLPSSPHHNNNNNKPIQFPQPVPVSISRVKPDKPPRPFSSLFGRVTPNAKPGAALAAAAASRNVPTPDAAVIISRRRSYNLARTESDCSDVDSKGRELGEKIDDSVERKVERSVSVDDVEIGEIEVNGDDVHVVSEEKPSPEVWGTSFLVPNMNDFKQYFSK